MLGWWCGCGCVLLRCGCSWCIGVGCLCRCRRGGGRCRGRGPMGLGGGGWWGMGRGGCGIGRCRRRGGSRGGRVRGPRLCVGLGVLRRIGVSPLRPGLRGALGTDRRGDRGFGHGRELLSTGWGDQGLLGAATVSPVRKQVSPSAFPRPTGWGVQAGAARRVVGSLRVCEVSDPEGPSSRPAGDPHRRPGELPSGAGESPPNGAFGGLCAEFWLRASVAQFQRLVNYRVLARRARSTSRSSRVA